MIHETILTAQNLTVCYGEHKVLNELSFSLQKGEIVMLVGANGAGKSTILKTLFGMKRYAAGKIFLDGKEISPRPDEMVRTGISFVPQDNRIFPEMNVRENIEIGGLHLSAKALLDERLEKSLGLFPQLKSKLRLCAAALSGGERQMVALARGLMTCPRLLFLDEPSLGLAPKLVGEVFAKIREVHQAYRTTILIVEHNLKSLLKIADRALILAKGRILKEGKPEELLHSKMLEEVFFGNMA